MNKKCYDAVIKEMQVLLDGQKFTADGEIFKNEKNAVCVSFDEENKLFVLKMAEVTDGTVGEFAVLTTWLFDDNQTERDAAAVGNDFADTLRSKLGLKAERSKATVSLPITEKGEEISVLTLTQKLLAFFPQYKEAYKAEVASYGKYLYVDFIASKFVPEIRNLIISNNKKQLKKLFDMLDEMYVDGDATTTDMVTSIIAAATFGDEKAKATAEEYIQENRHMKVCVNEMLSQLKHNKKLREALVK